MAGLKEIKQRRASAQNARKMTRAMKMISSARLRKAKDRILNLRSYARALEKAVSDIVLSQDLSHPFLEQKKDFEKPLFVAVTSDRGLCAAFNSNVCRFVEKTLKNSGSKPHLFFVGRKGFEYFQFRGIEGHGKILNLTKEVSYPFAASLSHKLMKFIISGEYDGVFIIYNEFKSLISPQAICERILPFDLQSRFLKRERRLAASDTSESFIFDAPLPRILSDLLDRCFSAQVYRCLCESVAAEHGARMTAMESATKNADDMISQLTLTYNKLRQSAITTELTEIVSGAEAIQG